MATTKTKKVVRRTTKKTAVRATGTNSSFLRRYTTLPALLHILHNRQITLLSPASWDDRNDAFFLSQYKDQMKAQSVLALCFSMASETYHHWRVFTHGSEGVCVEFEREILLAKLSRIDGLRSGPVKYERIDILETKPPSVDDLPFLKRLPYGDEQEFRLVYLDRLRTVEAKPLSIDLRAISRITLNPWMPKSLVSSVKATIQSIVGCSKIQVIRTTLLENERWKNTAIRR